MNTLLSKFELFLKMKKPLYKHPLLHIALFILFGTMLPKSLYATHIIGTELRYECLGNNEYKIILDVYRDCSDLANEPFDQTAFMSVFNDNFTYQIQPNINPTISFIDTIPVNGNNDPCLLPPSNICVARARYEKTVTFNQPGGLYVVYQRCCRNGSITNIEDPLNTGTTTWIYISQRSREECNNSPEFGFYPPPFVCVGYDIEFDHSANDKNGDSLVYKFFTPFAGADSVSAQPIQNDVTPPPYDADTITWIPPYSANNPIGLNSINLDPASGLITGMAQISGQFVVGILVEEYRDGELLSVLRRDFQYNVGPCLEVAATIDAPTAQCDNLTVEFGNDTNGPPNFLWYFDYPNTSPSSTEVEPTYTYPDYGTYTIALFAVPGFECVDTAFHEILLQSNSLEAAFSWETYDCTDETVLVLQDLSTDSISPPAKWHWVVTLDDNTTLTSDEQNPVFVIPNPSSGTILLEVESENGCLQNQELNFETGGNNPVDDLMPVIEICIGETAELNPNATTTGFTYQWGPPIPLNQQNLVNPSVTPLVTTTYAVTITGIDGLCQSTAEVTVEVSPEVFLDFEPDTDCDGRVVHFVNLSQNAPAGYSWNFGDPTDPGAGSSEPEPTYIYNDYGTYLVTLMTTPDAICQDTIQKEITLSEKILEAAFDFDYLTCEEGQVAVQFFDVSVNNQFNSVNWIWEFSGVYNGTSNQQNPTILVTEEGTLNVTFTVITDEACESTTIPQDLEIDLAELPGLINSEVLGCLSTGVTLNQGGDGAYSYQWTPSEGLSCTDCPSPFANPDTSTTYTVVIQIYSADTCEIIRQVTVRVPDDAGLVASDDITTCDSTALLAATNIFDLDTYSWFDEEGNLIAVNQDTVTVQVSGETYYAVQVIDQENCPYYDTVLVKGGPAQIAAFGDGAFCSDDVLSVFADNLDSNDTLSWQWTPAGAFNDPNSANPGLIITPGPQTFTVTAVNQFGCITEDSVHVDIVDVNNNLDFDWVIACNGTEVNFINQSTNAFNFSWNFGDPGTLADTSNLIDPTYFYANEGTLSGGTDHGL